MLLIVPLMPMGDALTNGAVAWPVWIALNSTDNLMITTASAVVMLGLGLVLTWVAAIAVASDSPARASPVSVGELLLKRVDPPHPLAQGPLSETE